MPLDLKEYFPEHYSDTSNHVIPLQFTGELKIFEFIHKRDHEYVSAGILGPYKLNVIKDFPKSAGLAREIGFFKIDDAFKKGIWSDCFYLRTQIYQLLLAEKFLSEVETGELIEEF